MDLTAEDADEHLGDRLTWSLENGPSWLLFTRTQIKGVPRNDDVGISWVNLKVTDMEGVSDELGFILEVKNTNDEPIWQDLPLDQNMTEGENLILSVVATDEDVKDRVYYNITSNPPSGIDINSLTGTVQWNHVETGNYTINISANDGTSWIYVEFGLIVKEERSDPPVINGAPFIDPVGDRQIEAGCTLQFQLGGSDPDMDTITFRLEEGPEGLVVSMEGKLVWTPEVEDVGVHMVNVSIGDGLERSFREFKVTVMLPSGIDDDTTDDDTGDDDGTENEANYIPYIGAIIALAVLLVIAIVLMVIIVAGRREEERKKSNSSVVIEE
jgi:hypothetical protein